MKLLHLYKDYFPEVVGGVPRFIFELAEGLSNRAVESHVLALYKEGQESPKKIGNHYAHMAKRDLSVASMSLSLDAISKFGRLVSEADIVHYHFPWPFGDLLYFLRGQRKPAIVTYHSDIVRQRLTLPIYAPLMQRFLSSAQTVIATSDAYFQTSPTLQRYSDKVRVIPIGIADRQEPSSDIVDKWRTRVGESFFLFVGCLRYYKGLSFLMEAVRQTDVRLVLVGDGPFPIENVPKNVERVGRVTDEDREALLSLCTAFVLSSHLRSEAFGIALLEASRAGKPMISCEIGTGTSYVNIHGETGLVVPPADAQSLVDAFSKITSNPERSKLMGYNARSRYERLFTSEHMCLPYLEIYQQLAEKSRIGSP